MVLSRFVKIVGLLWCIFAYANKVYAKECFIASKNNQLIHIEGDCDTRYPPCSTFKIAISLMGFDAGILMDETHPSWNFKSGYVDWLEKWKQPHNPKLWFTNSCVWYSQIITKKLGEKRFSRYIRLFEYGNQDVSGDTGMHNGLTNAWLSSSLAISPKEQNHFLNKLVTNTLPISADAIEKTKNILYQEVLANGYELYGKTGNGSQLDAEGHKIKDRQVGWFIGFLRKDKNIITFVQLIADDSKQATYASLRAKKAFRQRIKVVLLDEPHRDNS